MPWSSRCRRRNSEALRECIFPERSTSSAGNCHQPSICLRFFPLRRAGLACSDWSASYHSGTTSFLPSLDLTLPLPTSSLLSFPSSTPSSIESDCTSSCQRSATLSNAHVSPYCMYMSPSYRFLMMQPLDDALEGSLQRESKTT